jgi:hypothetical protein
MRFRALGGDQGLCPHTMRAGAGQRGVCEQVKGCGAVTGGAILLGTGVAPLALMLRPRHMATTNVQDRARDGRVGCAKLFGPGP